VVVDRQTLLPVRVLATLEGRTTSAPWLQDVVADEPLPPGTFDLRCAAGAEVARSDDGFRSVDLEGAGAAAGYAPPVPATLPAGFALARVAGGPPVVGAADGGSAATTTSTRRPASRAQLQVGVFSQNLVRKRRRSRAGATPRSDHHVRTSCSGPMASHDLYSHLRRSMRGNCHEWLPAQRRPRGVVAHAALVCAQRTVKVANAEVAGRRAAAPASEARARQSPRRLVAGR
jgi:hypothetical protein